MDIVAVVTKENAERFTKSMETARDKYEDDPEALHIEMDNIMCSFLRDLGFSKGVDIFEDVDKWYG